MSTHPYTVKNWLWVIIIGLFVVCFMLSGCSTVAGAGKDITSMADWTKEKIGGK